MEYVIVKNGFVEQDAGEVQKYVMERVYKHAAGKQVRTVIQELLK